MDAELLVDVELPGDWAVLCDAKLRPAAERGVAAAVDALAREFSVPAATSVRLLQGPAELAADGPWPLVRCGDAVRACSSLLAARVNAWVEAVPILARHFNPPAQALAQAASGATGARAITHLATLCAEVLRQHPADLLGPSQAAAFITRLRDRGIDVLPEERPSFAALLRRLLDQRIGLADDETIGRRWIAGRGEQLPVEHIAESLIDAESGRPVQIHVARSTLRAWTQDADEQAAALATQLRDEAHFDLGIAYPDFEFVVDESMPERAFCFGFRALRTLPVFGLDGAERPADLPALHPVTVPGGLRHMMASLDAELRALGPCFVSRADVVRALDVSTAVDAVLARHLLSRCTAESVTEMLRLLVVENVSIRNLRRIAESLCDFDHVVVDAVSLIVFDTRLPVPAEPDPAWRTQPRTLAACARMGLRTQLSRALDRDNAGLDVYLIERDVEHALATLPQDGRLSERDAAALLRGLRVELGMGSTATKPFVLLTTIEARAQLHEQVRDAYPWASVVAYQELTSDVTLRPVARIGFNR